MTIPWFLRSCIAYAIWSADGLQGTSSTIPVDRDTWDPGTTKGPHPWGADPLAWATPMSEDDVVDCRASPDLGAPWDEPGMADPNPASSPEEIAQPWDWVSNPDNSTLGLGIQTRGDNSTLGLGIQTRGDNSTLGLGIQTRGDNSTLGLGIQTRGDNSTLGLGIQTRGDNSVLEPGISTGITCRRSRLPRRCGIPRRWLDPVTQIIFCVECRRTYGHRGWRR